MSNLKKFEVMLPYHQYLRFEVEAHSAEEAVHLVDSGFDLNGENIAEDYSLGCGPNAKIKVRQLSQKGDEIAISKSELSKVRR